VLLDVEVGRQALVEFLKDGSRVGAVAQDDVG
jgi:hypothetical protein